MRKARSTLLRLLVLLVLLAVLLSGCSYPSGVRTLSGETGGSPGDAAPAPEILPLPEAGELVQQAVAATREAEKYWFTGYIANDIEKRRTTSMFDGAVYGPQGYLVNGRLVGHPFRYYRWEDEVFVEVDNRWYRAEEEPLPVDPLRGFDAWLPFLERAVRLPDEEVLSTLSTVLQVEINGREWLAQSDTPLLAEARARMEKNPDLAQVLEATEVSMKLWIGQEDGRIHQYQTWIIMPIPGAGYMEQEIFFRLYKFNDPGIQVNRPEDVEKWAQR